VDGTVEFGCSDAVRLNGRRIGDCNSLATPHEYDLSSPRRGPHMLSIRVAHSVRIVYDWNMNRKLGVVFEANIGKGKLLVCSIDLRSDLDHRPVARQVLHSLLQYASSSAFAPQTNLLTRPIEGTIQSIRHWASQSVHRAG
jgi:hypothetical protein